MGDALSRRPLGSGGQRGDDVSDYVWMPTADYIENANVSRLIRTSGVRTLQDLRRRSIQDVRWFWDAVVQDLGLPFHKPYSEVLDTSAGTEYPRWFVGGRINLAAACVDRWLEQAGTANLLAVVHEDEAGRVNQLTYRELSQQVDAVSRGLDALGVRPGDRVAIYLPMTPEAVITLYAVARLGAVLVPLFSGFAPSAITARLQDAGAKVVVVADGTIRRGRRVAMKPLLDQALTACPSVEHVVLVEHLGGTPPEKHVQASFEAMSKRVPVTLWENLVRTAGPSLSPVWVDPDEPVLLGYTSGTTGRPKGAVHTHAGFLVKTASEVAYSFDLKPGQVFTWITDMGWVMGPLSIVGTHANGGTLLLYEGSPDAPNHHRVWDLVERHGVAMLGVSPTLIRALRSSGDDTAGGHALSTVRVLGSTGEPWDPQSYVWMARTLFDGRVPVINFSGGTEVGGSFLAPYPVEPIRSCSLGGPSLGMDVDVVDDSGRPVRGDVGELVCRQPWPSMTKGIWGDDARYIEAYWSVFPGLWRHGDYAEIEADGQWFIRGRSDDVMNVAGKRVAPAEVEAVLTSHRDVAEAAVVGVTDPHNGESIWAFWVPRAGHTDDISGELRDLVGRQLGKPFVPKAIRRVSELPKTRSAKILRRAIRATVQGVDPGDLSGAENAGAIDTIRAAVGRPDGE